MKTVKEGIELNLDDLMKVAGGTGNSKETMRIEVDEAAQKVRFYDADGNLILEADLAEYEMYFNKLD